MIQAIKSMSRMLLPIGISAILVACGGGDDTLMFVGKSVASHDISGVVNEQKQALGAAGAEVASTRCYAWIKSAVVPGTVTTADYTPAPVLYVHLVRTRDLEAASALGFSADYSTTGFSPEERACVTTDADIPGILTDETLADAIMNEDIPADKVLGQ